MLTEQRSIVPNLLHVYVLYYFILKDFLIACHYKTYIMPTLFLLLMSSYAIINMFCFILDNTIMLTVWVTNIECLLIGGSMLEIQYNLDVVLCQLFMIASSSQ